MHILERQMIRNYNANVPILAAWSLFIMIAFVVVSFKAFIFLSTVNNSNLGTIVVAQNEASVYFDLVACNE